MTFRNLRLQVWDLGGQGSIRPYWRCYYQNTNGIVYVIDSSDTDRLDTAKREMMAMLQEEDLAGVPLLVFANKQDLPQAVNEAEVSEKLGLTGIKNRQWSIFGASATRNQGIAEGFEW